MAKTQLQDPLNQSAAAKQAFIGRVLRSSGLEVHVTAFGLGLVAAVKLLAPPTTSPL